MAKYSLVTLSNPKSAVAEAYRTLRTNIQFANVDDVIKRLLVTSAGPGEGKSSTVANLGVALAQTGKSVLIIDADLRNPTQHKIWGKSNLDGLSTTLVNDIPSLTHVVDTPHEGLHVLLSGPIPPNPAELLGSKRMKKVLADLTAAYDLVLIDSPPVIAVADSSILAQSVDGVMLVIGYGEVSREFALQAKTQLEKVGAKVIGAILNKVEMKTKQYHYYYYYQSSSKHTAGM